MNAAVALQQDHRYQTLAAARKANDENKALQQAIGDFNLARMDLNNELAKTERDPVRLSELNTSINDLYAKIMGDETMIEYNEAKEDINDVIKYINAIVTAAVDGEDPLKVEPPAPEGCGPDGCDGCAGCG
ncbi:MAG: YlbF family regulator [Ruminococcaceae bacterium]|nr:YlbF family regulator [Oscillospiraceae bacterium]